jgi:hypothetical protein
MNRWSLSNRFSKISYEQFKSLTAAFQEAAEHAYGTPTKLEIKTMRAPAMSVSIPDPEMLAFLKQQNEKNTTLKTDTLDDISKEDWDKAAYVEVNIHPEDKSKGPQSAFAQVEFKGHLPKQATFYIQGGDTGGVQEATLRHRPRLSKVGDGYNANGSHSYR